LAHNKLYRNFIILQEDERGYSHSNDKALSGYAKVEAKGDKCKVSFYAQNLKQEDNYSMVLICSKRDLKQLIDLGPLEINGVGKGDASKEYYVNNIAGLGMSYDKISGAAICKVNNNEPEFIMHGFMNGEESTDNWRKYKIVKVDSKNYINKLDSDTKKKDIVSLNIENKVTSEKLETVLVDRKKDEVNLQLKENIESGSLKIDSSKVEEKQQNSAQFINALDEDRNKCKDTKKCEKHDKCEKMDSIEDAIKELCNKIDTYDGVIDFKINNVHEDVIIYCFIKDKKDCHCKWKKFKVEKKCRSGQEEFNNTQYSSRRIEENFKLDLLNAGDTSHRIDRLDILDFDQYETEIQQPGLGIMGELETEDVPQQKLTPIQQPTVQETMEETSEEVEEPMVPETVSKPTTEVVQPTVPEIVSQPITESVPQIETQTICQPSTGTMQSTVPEAMQQPSQKQVFNITGEIGLYFEKLAEDFQQYSGSLADINYCKLYKVNVNCMEDLSDESNYNKYTLAYYPMLNYYPYISKAGHFLLGYKCNSDGEMKYIIYAVPGSKDKRDQPYGGRTGFVTWTTDNRTGKGYWLMFYDFKNSSIVIPTK